MSSPRPNKNLAGALSLVQLKTASVFSRFVVISSSIELRPVSCVALFGCVQSSTSVCVCVRGLPTRAHSTPDLLCLVEPVGLCSQDSINESLKQGIRNNIDF